MDILYGQNFGYTVADNDRCGPNITLSLLDIAEEIGKLVFFVKLRAWLLTYLCKFSLFSGLF